MIILMMLLRLQTVFMLVTNSTDFVNQPLHATVLGALPRGQEGLALASYAAPGMYLCGV